MGNYCGFREGPIEAAASPPRRTAGLRGSGTPVNGVPVAARATAYLTGRKWTRERYWFLLGVQIGRRRSAASTATLTGDGDGAGLANRCDATTFRRLDPANRLEVVLRQCTKGQEGRSFNGGMKFHRAACLTGGGAG